MARKLNTEKMKERLDKYLLQIYLDHNDDWKFGLENASRGIVYITEQRAKEWFDIGIDYIADDGLPKGWKK